MATGTGIEVVMPQMGVSVSEGTITRWLKGEGDPVALDEPLLEISTDKVDTEVPSPGEGVLGQILVQEGETVAVGTAIAVITSGDAAAAVPAPGPTVDVSVEPAPAELVAPEPIAPAPEPVAAGAPAPPFGDEEGEGRAFVSPVVARIAAEQGVDVAAVPGTGRGGRVTKKDILAFLEAGPPMKTRVERAAEPAREPAPPPPVVPVALPAEGEVFEPLSVMRQAISEHMMRSIQTSAHVTTVFEIDMSRVVAIRERLKHEYEERYGVRLTYLAFIARAIVDALRTWPWLNGEIRGDQIVTRGYVNLGVAVAIDDGKGLIVPVIRHAEQLNLLGIAGAVQDLAERARTKKLSPDEVHGGTFTITNPGGFGAIAGTPIINQPQTGIIDVEAIVKRPVVVDDEHGADVIAIRPMMNLCLSYDHRLVDGAYAAPFMREVRTSLETWDEDAY